MSTRLIPAAALAAVLLAAAVTASTAQTAGEAPRPHHASYGDDSRYHKPATQAEIPVTRAAVHPGLHRAHHADY